MSIKTAVTLPEDLVEKLDEYAAERGLLRRDIITYVWEERKTHNKFYSCPHSAIQHEGKFFCAYGEREDDE